MAERQPRRGYQFPAPAPKEALDYFRVRGIEVGFDYRDVWLEEHARAFTVAKAMNVEILDDIRAALDKAIADGTTLQQFRKDLTPLLQRKGWWGKKVMKDPLTGEQVVAQLGSPRRLRTIYRANLRAARAAGIWQRAQRTKKTLPYFLYELGPSKEHRKEHSDWAGTLLPVDDPWWNDHFPPNGWGCKCRVRQVSRRDAGRRGGPTSRPARNPEERVNRRTGEVQIVDKGIDPAWASNPGKDWRRSLMANLNGKLNRADYKTARGAIHSAFETPILDRFVHAPRGDLPGGVLDRRNQARLKADTHLVLLPEKIMRKQKGEWRKKRGDGSLRYKGHLRLTAREYRLLPDLIERPQLVMRFMPGWPPLTAEQLALRLNLVSEVEGAYYNVVIGRHPDNPAKVSLISFHELEGGQEQVERMVKAASTGIKGQEVFLNTFKFK